MKKRFEKFSDDFLEFDKVQNKLSSRPDLHAFLLLDKIMPGNTDIIVGAEHDEIYLGVDHEKLEEVITDKQIQELVRSGVTYCQYGLMMYT